MKNIVLFTTRPITSKYTKSLIEQMCILKEYQEKGYGIILVTPKKSKKNIDYIEEVAGIKINQHICYIDHYKEVMMNPKPIYNSWYEYLEKETLFDDLQNVEEIIIFGGMLSDATGLTREKNHFNFLMGTKRQMNFIANGSYMTGMLQLIKLSQNKKIPVHEICYDPCENSIDQLDYKPYKYYCYHGYDWADYNLLRLDSLQAYLEGLPEENYFFEDPPEKEIDLCVGLTALTEHREKQYDDVMEGLESNPNINKKLFIRHKRLDIDTFVPRDVYMESIKRSRYTLMVPPYDLQHFSIYRFLESVYNDCIPLITSDVNISDFVKSFKIDENRINKLIVDYKTIGNKINELSEEDRTDLLEYFKGVCLVNKEKLKIGF